LTRRRFLLQYAESIKKELLFQAYGGNKDIRGAILKSMVSAKGIGSETNSEKNRAGDQTE
jgi:hypothetical protein